MDKEGLIKRIENKFNKFGSVHVNMEIREHGEKPDMCVKLISDDGELCLLSESGDWVYPLNELTKRELEFLIKEINKNK